jgi:hypothetical protein
MLTRARARPLQVMMVKVREVQSVSCRLRGFGRPVWLVLPGLEWQRGVVGAKRGRFRDWRGQSGCLVPGLDRFYLCYCYDLGSARSGPRIQGVCRLPEFIGVGCASWWWRAA